MVGTVSTDGRKFGHKFEIMTAATIEDNELNAELQELYLVNKQWLSDLEFLDTELGFLTKLAANNATTRVRTEELNTLRDIENTYVVLKKDMLEYLHQLEPLISCEKERYGHNS